MKQAHIFIKNITVFSFTFLLLGCSPKNLGTEEAQTKGQVAQNYVKDCKSKGQSWTIGSYKVSYKPSNAFPEAYKPNSNKKHIFCYTYDAFDIPPQEAIKLSLEEFKTILFEHETPEHRKVSRLHGSLKAPWGKCVFNLCEGITLSFFGPDALNLPEHNIDKEINSKNSQRQFTYLKTGKQKTYSWLSKTDYGPRNINCETPHVVKNKVLGCIAIITFQVETDIIAASLITITNKLSEQEAINRIETAIAFTHETWESLRNNSYYEFDTGLPESRWDQY